jgi:hypothetical protein
MLFRKQHLIEQRINKTPPECNLPADPDSRGAYRPTVAGSGKTGTGEGIRN